MNQSGSQDAVEIIEIYLVDLKQDKPYLGSLREGETINESGYFVRQGNRTVYPRKNRSLVVKITTGDGVIGWGETYGLVAPQATAAIISDLLTGFVIGRDPFEVEAIHDELYDLMRVRGYTGGFYLDALAAVDIALWDIAGKIAGVPVAELLGGFQHRRIPAYVSGLPEDTLTKRCELAQSWQERGFDSLKFALPVADDGAVTEIKALRETLGDNARIAIDLHWSLTGPDALTLAEELSPFRPWFLEAPVATEEIETLREVAQNCGERIAVGEEWRTVYDARHRIDRKACHIVQPEMGHTGITQFKRIAKHAETNNLEIIPHATIGSGIFLAASLQASAALDGVTSHEFQHSIFGPFRHFTGDVLECESGSFNLTHSPGIGVEPSDAMLKCMTLIPS
ncbi:mandelate racemase/muconate lactonizing enzyme family protein [Verrucomicrobiales bacterium BCK34]|nr:mandelate racemase/muconate lactonizing enzyme family protein [Verrucomicrobiales bacterium BCK34]